MSNQKGFTLVESIVVIAIIGVLSIILLITLNTVKERARDAKRKHDVAQFGRFLSSQCYLPIAGGGEYDLLAVINEINDNNPGSSLYDQVPRDPLTGSAAESKYIYMVTTNGMNCGLYTNLEYDRDKVTLPGISSPTPGIGLGVLEASSNGWNHSKKYFQITN